MASMNTRINETSVLISIDKVSELKNVFSTPITLQDLPWQISLYKSVREQVLGLRLTCMGTRDRSWSCAATASIELKSFKSEDTTLSSTILPFVFSTETNQTSVHIVKWDTLMDRNQEYVKNNRAKIHIKIMANDSESHKTNLQVVNRTSDSVKLKLTVHGASSLLAISSTPFDFGSTSWMLVVIGPGYRQETKTKLSTMLWCTNQNSSVFWKRDILGSASINTSVTSQFKEGARKLMQFSEKCTKRFFTDTILWSDLKTPSKGFIHPSLDYLVIEFDLKVQRAVGNASGSTDLAVAETLPCTICFESMIGRSAVNTDCGHMFCKTCITAWIQERQHCPLCDAVLTASQLHQLYLP